MQVSLTRSSQQLEH